MSPVAFLRESSVRRTAVNHHTPHQKLRRPSGADGSSDTRLAVILPTLVLLIITAWSYWPTIADLLIAWRSDDNYSAGQLVPLVAVFLVWRERRLLRQHALVPCWWGGIALVLLAEMTRSYGYLSMRPAFERYALVLAMAGLVLLVAGWQVVRRVVWILLFLFLMVPLPGVVHNLVSGPLQRLATTGSVFLLEAFGVSVSQQGNVVMLNGNTPLAVAEACSGLRMLMAFIIVAAFIAYMVKRPRWQKAVLLVSSIPVAVVCNIIRIFATALLMVYVSVEMAQKFFHDFAGYVMMPIAVLLLFGELSLIDRIILPDSGSGKGQGGAKAKSVVRARKGPSPDAPDCA